MPDVDELDRAAADIPLTHDARAILERAARSAARNGASNTSPADVLEATLEEPKSLAAQEFRALGVDPASIVPERASDGAVPLRQLIVNANREAQILGHHRVDSIHLLLAMLYSDSPSTAVPLQKAGLTLYDVRNHLQTGAGPAERELRRHPWPRLRGVIEISPVFLGIAGAAAISGALLWTDPMVRLAGPLTIVFVTAGWVTSLCIHEFGHAFVAYLGGDRAVAASGYLTLNPLRYTNVVFSIVMPVVFLLLGGIGLPGGAVYINHSALRSRRWSSAVSLAGPLGTLLCAVLVAAPFFGSGGQAWAAEHMTFAAGLAFLGFIEIFALVLNLIPVPGLDGFGAIRPWLPYSWQASASRIGMNGIFFVFLALWFFAPLRTAFYQVVFQLTTIAHINLFLIFIGQSHMRLM